MEVLEALLEELDMKRTNNKVKMLFKKQFPRISRLAGISPTSLRSPFIDDMPKDPSYGNRTEEAMITYADRRYEYENVLLAIQHCSFISQQIIILDLVQENSNQYVADTLKYGETTYKLLKKQATAEFADTYEAIAGEDLHVYKK